MNFNNMIGQLITSQIQKQTQSSAGGGGLDLGSIGSALGGMLGGGSSSNAGGSLGGLGNLGAIAGMLTGGSSNSGGGAADILGKVIGMAGGGDAAKMGGLAMIGGLAYKAFNAYKAKQSNVSTAYDAPENEETAMKDGLLIIRAMIGAAAADGKIDREEYSRIFAKAQDGGLTSEEREFMQKEMESPCDARSLALQVDNTRQAAQVYAAAAMTSKIDSQSERAFMDDLQQYMSMDSGLAQQIEQEVAQVA